MSTESDGTHYYGDGCPEHSVCQPLLGMPCKDCDGCMSLDEATVTVRADDLQECVDEARAHLNYWGVDDPAWLVRIEAALPPPHKGGVT